MEHYDRKASCIDKVKKITIDELRITAV